MVDVESYQKIDAVFQKALDLDPAERLMYISGACENDPVFIKEVERLLRSAEEDWTLIDTPAFEIAAPLLITDAPVLKSGDTIGQYTIQALLGAGGMGHVYLAEDRKLRRKVALKLLSPASTRAASKMQRVEHEARAASALNHPNIITIYELGEADGHQFIATEYVEGETLRERLRHGKVPPNEAVDIAIQMASALAAAHDAGIIHRDIKPENVMLRRDGFIKVLDFGLAKLTEVQEHPVNISAGEVSNLSSGLVMGTVKYMSPEQARGQSVGGRSDIFSFGVVLYEMLSGRAPFDGGSAPDLIAAIVTRSPKTLSCLPDRLRLIVDRALEKDPEDRYASFAEVLADLRQAKSGLEAKPTTLGRVLIFASAVIVILVIALGLTWVLRSGTRGRNAAGQLRPTRLPGTEKAIAAAISPDGRSLVQTSFDSAGATIELLDIASGRKRSLGSFPRKEPPLALRFSSDGEKVFYTVSGGLYRSSLDGATLPLIEHTDCKVLELAPDEASVACLTRNDAEDVLRVISLAGGEAHIVARRSQPEFLSSPAWSPDGRQVAYATATSVPKSAANITTVDLASGAEKKLSSEQWSSVDELVWRPDGSGLIAVGQYPGGPNSQIWEISYPGGERYGITHDLESYSSITLSRDGTRLAVIDSKQLTSIWLVPSSDFGNAKPVTSGENYYYRFISWTGDGRIVFKSSIQGGRDIWIMNADGSDARQLTVNLGENQQPRQCGDQPFLIFSSNRFQQDDRVYEVWRMNLDGTDAVQITHGENAVQPACSPDGRTLVHSRGGPYSDSTEKSLWKMPINGGDPVPITDRPAMGADISADGKLIAGWYLPEGAEESADMKLAVFPIEGGLPLRIFDVPLRTYGQPVRWGSDGRSIYYASNVGGIGNVWAQPLNGDSPSQVTKFTSETIEGFDRSADGRLICSRRRAAQDVIVMSNF